MTSGDIVGDKYRVGRRIGSGSFGSIYLGTSVDDESDVAIKMEPIDCKAPMLKQEYRVYTALRGQHGFPQAFFYGMDSSEKNHVLVIELLGPTLDDLHDFCGRKVSLRTVLQIGDQMLSRLEALHRIGYLHRDVKPENFLIGTKDNATILYLIDFGLSRKYINPKTGRHVIDKGGPKKALIGTARYASCNAHLGLELSRRDDLESVGYILLYLLNGELPWMGIKAQSEKEQYDKIGQKKMGISLEDLCKGHPPAFQAFLVYAKSLSFEQEPDYFYMKSLFFQLSEKLKYPYDGLFDWSVVRQRPKLTVTVLSANSLYGKDRSGFSDPYVTLSLGKIKVKTEVVMRCLEPKWDESFDFEIFDLNAVLFVHVWNKNSLKQDQFLGMVTLPIACLKIE